MKIYENLFNSNIFPTKALSRLLQLSLRNKFKIQNNCVLLSQMLTNIITNIIQLSNSCHFLNVRLSESFKSIDYSQSIFFLSFSSFSKIFFFLNASCIKANLTFCYCKNCRNMPSFFAFLIKKKGGICLGFEELSIFTWRDNKNSLSNEFKHIFG